MKLHRTNMEFEALVRLSQSADWKALIEALRAYSELETQYAIGKADPHACGRAFAIHELLGYLASVQAGLRAEQEAVAAGHKLAQAGSKW